MNSLPSFFRFHLRLFQILGYFPISLNKKLNGVSKSETFLRFWSLFLLFVFTSMSFCVFGSNDEYLFQLDDFGYFNDGMKFGFAQISVTTFYIETFLRHRDLRKFWRGYLSLQREQNARKFAPPVQGFSTQFRRNIWYILVFYSLTLMDIALLLVFIFCEELTRHLVLFWTMFSPFTMFVHLRNKQFIFHLELLRFELIKLQNDLSLLADYTRFVTRVRPFNGFEEFLRRKLLEKQKTYQCIYDMYESFQKAFSYSIVAALLMVYVRVLVDAYFTYYSVYEQKNHYEILLILPSCFEIPVFLWTSKNCMNAVKYVTFQLHSIISPLDGTVLSTQIQNFSLQLLHQQIKINGVGIATMDGYMLTRAIGSITTYMLFFIQFMPKFGYSKNQLQTTD